MEILSDVLIKVFRFVSTKDIISGAVQYDNVTLQLLGKISYAYDEKGDELETDKKLQYLKDRIEFEIHEDGNQHLDASSKFGLFSCNGDRRSHKSDTGLDIYDLVDSFAKAVLIKDHEEIVCQFAQLQTWRMVSSKLGEDLFVAALYAYIDYRYGKTRSTFFWRNMIGHNNAQLNMILSRGMSENHFHLHGSTPYFDLSWSTLMNCVNQPQFLEKLDKIDAERRMPRVNYQSSYEDTRYRTLHMQAVLIRVFLYAQLTEKLIKLKEYTAPWEWLLDYIFEKEQVFSMLTDYQTACNKTGNMSYRFTLVYDENRNAAGIDDIFDFAFQEMENRIAGTGDGCGVNLKEQVQRQCPAFSWLIWEKLPRLLCSEQQLELCSGKGITGLSELMFELTSQCPRLALEECQWIFEREGMEIFKKEWNAQTYSAVMYYLQTPILLLGMRKDLQRVIDGLQDHQNIKKKDYAINAAGSWYKEDYSSVVLSGERWLLYTMMRKRYKRTDGPGRECYNLFYAYLTIKEAFRMELIQSNERIGFTNFKKYQNRKYWFTADYTAGDLAGITVETVLKNQVINNLEIRIHPGDTCEQNVNIIKEYDEAIDKAIDKGKKFRQRHFFVFHFSKRPDKKLRSQEPSSYMYYRHYELHKKIRTQTEAIIQFRRKNPKIAQRLRGIDACSQEDGCRPEVFATAYRSLKRHSCYQGLSLEPQVPQLRATYHVGEEFQDILDGLRAVDEAVRFLGLNCGDRLGHAIVLGLDANEWYRRKGYRVTIRQQDYLDNIVWLYHKLIRYQIPDTEVLQDYLNKKFQLQFSLIYGKTINTEYIEKVLKAACEYDREYGSVNQNGMKPYDFNINTYYYSWMLRGDHPGLYSNGFCERNRTSSYFWDDCSVNSTFPKDHKIRYMPEAVVLNHYYHYDMDVKVEGSKSIVVQIPAFMVAAISAVQKEMQKEIASRGIAIETNPSSNVMISTFKSYDRHPIIQFYNMGLTYDSEKLRECAQFNVSINTDDQGVFATSLSNEYALMVSALYQMKDENGNHIYQKSMIYEWIDNIRKMGNDQSFQQNGNKGSLPEDLYFNDLRMEENAGIYNTFGRSRNNCFEGYSKRNRSRN